MSNARGGNLKQPLKKILLNVPGPENLGTFRDESEPGNFRRFLQFKHHGLTLPYRGLNNMAARTIVQRNQPHVDRISVFSISNVAPANGLNYDYGIKISERVRKPGVDNDNFFAHQKFYGGTMPFVTTPLITDAERTTMRNGIVQQINADNGLTRKFAYQRPGAAVVASPVARLQTWGAAATITIDGTLVGAQANIGAFVNAINTNATLTGRYFAWINPEVPATEFFLIKTSRAVNPNVLPTIAVGAPLTYVAGNQLVWQVALTNRYTDVTFDVLFKPSFGSNAVVRPGSFAFLTTDEVRQQFSHLPNMGMLAQEKAAVNQVLDVPYVKVIFEVTQPHWDLGGAAHGVGFTNAIEVYIPATEWDAGANRWEVANASGRIMDAGVVNNLAAVLAMWAT